MNNRLSRKYRRKIYKKLGGGRGHALRRPTRSIIAVCATRPPSLKRHSDEEEEEKGSRQESRLIRILVRRSMLRKLLPKFNRSQSLKKFGAAQGVNEGTGGDRT